MSDPSKSTVPSDDFDNWREPLLASLRDCGVQPAPRHPVLRYFLAIASMSVTVILSMIAGTIIGTGLRGAPPVVVFLGYAVLLLLVVPIFSRVSNRFLRQAWQSSARNAEDEIRKLGSRRPILYLRSFGLDSRVGRPSWLERYLGTRPMATAEQQFTRTLRKLGPVIDIGRPGEKLPALGAARFYVSHERWQEKVADVLRASQLVVWATGVTEGLRWEILHLTVNLNPRRILIWAHPYLLGVSQARREAEWRLFLDKLGSIFPKPLPEKLGDARFFIFEADWIPIPVAPRLSDVFTNPQTSALRQATELQQNGLSDAQQPVPKVFDPEQSATDLGSIIGARGARLSWTRIGVFFLAMVALGRSPKLIARILSIVHMSNGVSWEMFNATLFSAAIWTVAAVVAFRFIRNSALAAFVTGGMVAILLFLTSGATLHSERLPAWAELGIRIGMPWLNAFVFFGSLSWSIRRCPPFFLGLLIGAFISKEFTGVMQWIITSFTHLAMHAPPGLLLEDYVQFTNDALHQFAPNFVQFGAVCLLRAAAFAITYAVLRKILKFAGFEQPAITT